jgi:hypothetical protein
VPKANITECNNRYWYSWTNRADESCAARRSKCHWLPSLCVRRRRTLRCPGITQPNVIQQQIWVMSGGNLCFRTFCCVELVLLLEQNGESVGHLNWLCFLTHGTVVEWCWFEGFIPWTKWIKRWTLTLIVFFNARYNGGVMWLRKFDGYPVNKMGKAMEV